MGVALRRCRPRSYDCLTLQVKKLEDRAGQLGREKEELCQALTVLKKGQSIAAGPAQTRTVNLMRRVHTLVLAPGSVCLRHV